MNELSKPLGKIFELELQKRWELLKQEGKYSQAAASVACTPLIEQLKMGKSLDLVFQNRKELPSVNDMIKYQGEDYTKIVITGYLNKLSSLGVVRNMLNDEENISDLVDMLIEKYPTWKLIEYRNVIKSAIMGEYGTIYDRIDPAVVFEWFGKYEMIRLRKLEDERIKEQKAIESEQMSKEMAGKLAKAFECVNVAPKDSPSQFKRYRNPKELLSDPGNQLMVKEWTDNHKFCGTTQDLSEFLLDRAITLMRSIEMS